MRLVDITPQSIVKLNDKLLFSLWQKLNIVWESENPDKEEIIIRSIFLINEMREREMDIKDTPLFKVAEEWREKHKDNMPESMQEAIRAPFGSPGGKRYMAARLIKMFPQHKTYVETFTGGGAVFWKKKPSMKEVLNDKDDGIIMAYRTIQNLTEQQWEQLKKMDWVYRKTGYLKYKKRFDASSGMSLERFHDFIYLKQCSDLAEMKSYDGRDEGNHWAGVNTLMKMKERIKDVIIEHMDYAELIKKYDSPDTFFYIDPPYPSAKLAWKWMPTTEEVESAVTGLKGKWLLSYELTPAFKEFKKDTIGLWSIGKRDPNNTKKQKQEQLVHNYDIQSNMEYFSGSDSGAWSEMVEELAKMDNYSGTLSEAYEKSKCAVPCEIEFGARTNDMKEYFFSVGSEDYRILHRKINSSIAEQIDESLMRSVIANHLYDDTLNDRIQEALLNPYDIISNIDLIKDCRILASAEKTGWITIEPFEQLPYVLTAQAGELDYMPALGLSALPRKMRESVPEEYQFWTAEDEDQALLMRDLLVEAINNGLTIHEKDKWRYKSPRNRCMNCSMAPTHEVLWAEGKGHAWFCKTHLKGWMEEHKGDVDYIKEVKDGEAAKKFSDNTNPNIRKDFKEVKFSLHHQWFKESLGHWDLRIDTGDDIIHMVLEYNPLKENKIECNLQCSKDNSWMERGRKVERINPGEPGNLTESSLSWMHMVDEGGAKVLERTESHMRIKFSGKNLKESWIATKSNGIEGHWILHKG